MRLLLHGCITAAVVLLSLTEAMAHKGHQQKRRHRGLQHQHQHQHLFLQDAYHHHRDEGTLLRGRSITSPREDKQANDMLSNPLEGVVTEENLDALIGDRPPLLARGDGGPLVIEVQSKCREDYELRCGWARPLIDMQGWVREDEQEMATLMRGLGHDQQQQQQGGEQEGEEKEGEEMVTMSLRLPPPPPLGFGSVMADDCMRNSLAVVKDECRDAIATLDASSSIDGPSSGLSFFPINMPTASLPPPFLPSGGEDGQRAAADLLLFDPAPFLPPPLRRQDAMIDLMASPPGPPPSLDRHHEQPQGEGVIIGMKKKGMMMPPPPGPMSPQRGPLLDPGFMVNSPLRQQQGGVWVQGNPGDELDDEDAGAGMMALALALLMWLGASVLVVTSFIRAERRREMLLHFWQTIHDNTELKTAVEQAAGLEFPRPPKHSTLRKFIRAVIITTFVAVFLHLSLHLAAPPAGPPPSSPDGGGDVPPSPFPGGDDEDAPPPPSQFLAFTALSFLLFIALGFVLRALISLCTGFRSSNTTAAATGGRRHRGHGDGQDAGGYHAVPTTSNTMEMGSESPITPYTAMENNHSVQAPSHGPQVYMGVPVPAPATMMATTSGTPPPVHPNPTAPPPTAGYAAMVL